MVARPGAILPCYASSEKFNLIGVISGGRAKAPHAVPLVVCFKQKIFLDGADQSAFPIGAQGTAAIYTSGEYGAWAALRKIAIRSSSWLNWLYPINF